MKLLFFGITKDIVGKSKIEGFKLNDGNTVEDLLRHLKGEYPRLGEISSLAVGVNEEYAKIDTKLNENDEVALIPPVSGG